MHETYNNISDFEWQEGYGAFTISTSQIDQTIKYIANQEEHHRKITFRDEFVSFLKLHGIEFEEKYLL